MSKKNNAPTFFYILSLLSFLPVIGVIIGVILLVIVYTEKFGNRKILNTILIFGILSSFAFYYFISKTYIWGNIYHHTTVVESTKKATNLVNKIEVYKKKYGHFPNNLTALNDNENTIDPIQIINESENPQFYYQLKNDGYYLFSIGFDKIPFTSDDVFPNIKCKNKGEIGLINCIAKKKRHK